MKKLFSLLGMAFVLCLTSVQATDIVPFQQEDNMDELDIQYETSCGRRRHRSDLAYGSFYLQGSQAITPTVANTYSSVTFPTTLAGPVNIAPNVGGTEFQVLRRGSYLITWSLSTTSSGDVTGSADFSLFIHNITANTDAIIPPSPNLILNDVTDTGIPVSGQTIVTLTSDQSISLRVALTSVGDTLTVTNPTLTISQVDR